MSLENTIIDVYQERGRQYDKWGNQRHDLGDWFLIWLEEVGEVAKELNEVHFRAKSPEEMRKELIEAIAVATRMVDQIDEEMQ